MRNRLAGIRSNVNVGFGVGKNQDKLYIMNTDGAKQLREQGVVGAQTSADPLAIDPITGEAGDELNEAGFRKQFMSPRIVVLTSPPPV